MTDQSRKPLSLKKPNHDTDGEAQVPLPRKRSGKRIIRREQLPQQSLANTKPPPAKPAKKRQQAKQSVDAKKPTVSPSDLRIAALDQQLQSAFAVWRDDQPLALKIEKRIFRFISENHISASKRVVQKLLKRHTSTRSYRDNILQQAQRYELDGTPAGEISQLDKDHAQRQAGVAHSA